MSLRIQNNIEAFNAHRQLTGTSMRLSKSMEKLSSGYRINRAADDSAGPCPPSSRERRPRPSSSRVRSRLTLGVGGDGATRSIGPSWSLTAAQPAGAPVLAAGADGSARARSAPPPGAGAATR